jgi:hypothetical protein
LLTGAIAALAVAPSGATSEFSACGTAVPSPVAEVTGLLWTGTTALSWSAAAGAAEYRVLRGALADLSNLLDGDADGCERLVVPATGSGPVLTEDPWDVPGRLYWYLVVGRNGPDEGSAGSASAGPRLANGGSCP